MLDSAIGATFVDMETLRRSPKYILLLVKWEANTMEINLEGEGVKAQRDWERWLRRWG